MGGDMTAAPKAVVAVTEVTRENRAPLGRLTRCGRYREVDYGVRKLRFSSRRWPTAPGLWLDAAETFDLRLKWAQKEFRAAQLEVDRELACRKVLKVNAALPDTAASGWIVADPGQAKVNYTDV